MIKKTYISVLMLLFLSINVWSNEVENMVINCSTTIRTAEATGSGTLFLNKYILTAGHVVRHLRNIEKIQTEENGEMKEVKKVSWENAKVVQTIFKNGKEVGELIVFAKVIAFSPSEEDGGIDLAVLELLDDSYIKNSARFLPDNNNLEIGTDICHIGSLYGELTGSFIKGNISRLDHKYLNRSFNVANLNVKGGSSGGGVFKLIDGKYYYCGMVVRSDDRGTTLLKPPHVIREWLKENKLDKILN